MSDLPSTPEEFYAMLAALNADLSRSRVLLESLSLPMRPETIDVYSRRLEQLEEIARWVGLPVDRGTNPLPE